MLRTRLNITILSLLGLFRQRFVGRRRITPSASRSSSRLNLSKNPRRKEVVFIFRRAQTRSKEYFLKNLIIFALSFLLAQNSWSNQKETYKDLISKSQNLSLQQDRLQACQVLIRALQKEAKSTPGYFELKASLESLSTLFYTDQAQAIFSQGESLFDAKTKEAIEKYQEALKLEEGNVAILRALARAQLRTDDCRGAESTIKMAEAYDNGSAELYLLKLQGYQCRKDEMSLGDAIEGRLSEHESVEKYLKVFSVETNFLKKDLKKAKSLLNAWESQSPDYPEVHFWKWKISSAQGLVDKASGQKYLQLCKAMTPRKRKMFNLDVDLCKAIDEVDAKLKLTH